VPGHEGVVGNETADQLARTGSEHAFIRISLRHLNWSCQESSKGLEEQKSHETLGISNLTQAGKGTYTTALCQKNKGSVKIKHRPVKMGGKTIYKTLSP
jgi:hypothetical protein